MNNDMFGTLINTQPFDDGFIVCESIGGGSAHTDFIIRHGADGEEKLLRVFLDCREGMESVSAQYDRAAGISSELVRCCGQRKTTRCEGDDICLVELGRTVEGKEIPPSAVVRMGIDICRELSLMQQSGYVHRNVKPSNISFENGTYYLNSFELMEKSGEDDNIVGTPAFMAPEAINGNYNMTTDIYALALTMYCLLNKNRMPFTTADKSANEAFRLRAGGNTIPAINSAAPMLMDIILKACAFSEADRYSGADEMLEALVKYYEKTARSTKINTEALKRELTGISEFSDRWEIEQLLGAGSYGAVYAVSDKKTGNRYALKVVSIHSLDEEENRESFTERQLQTIFDERVSRAAKEALMWTSLSSCKNVVRLHESGRLDVPGDKHSCYFLMCSELLSPIEYRIDDENTVARLGLDVCNALRTMHSIGLTHRDIKPGNIMFSPSDGYKLGDFGITRVLKYSANATVIGTATYMAPELLVNYFDQKKNTEYNNSVDIYSLGLTMYTLLNRGRGPFTECDYDDVTDNDIRRDNSMRAKGAEFPRAEFASEQLMRIIRKACAFEPSERYTSVEDIYEALQCFLDR